MKLSLSKDVWPGVVARSVAKLHGVQGTPKLTPTSGTFFCEGLVIKIFLQHSSSSVDSKRAAVSKWPKKVH